MSPRPTDSLSRSSLLKRLLGMFLLVLLAVLGTAILLACAAHHPLAFAFKTLDHPGAGAQGTYVTGISGSTIVGYYRDDNFLARGFIYDTVTASYSPLTYPTAGTGPNRGTFPMGVNGANIVGYCETDDDNEHGYTYNLKSQIFTLLDHPDAEQGNYLNGIAGGNIVGFYRDNDYNAHGFLFDGANFTLLDDPSGARRPGAEALSGSFACGISGTTVVGYYQDGTGLENGFVFDGHTYQTLVYPSKLSASDHFLAQIFHDPLVQGPVQLTDLRDVDGRFIVGYYQDDIGFHGFLFDGSVFTSFDEPVAAPGTTQATGISGDTIVGFYQDDKVRTHGFLAQPLPPPAPWPWFAGAFALDAVLLLLACDVWRKR